MARRGASRLLACALACAALGGCAVPTTTTPADPHGAPNPAQPARAPSAAPAPAPPSAEPAPTGASNPGPTRYVPPAPLVVAVEAPGASELRTFHLDDASSLVVAREPNGELRAARIAGHTVERLPNLDAGLAADARTLEHWVLGGRYPDALWLGVSTERVACDAYAWRGAAWQASGRAAGVGCTAIRAWTPDAAIAAVVDGQDRPLLHAFGKAPPALPELAPAKAPGCPGRLAAINALAAWPSGEVALVGYVCNEPLLVAQHWAGTTVASRLELVNVDANSPFEVRAPQRDELRIYGMGLLPGQAPSDAGPVEARVGMRGGKLAVLDMKVGALADLERWLLFDAHESPASAQAEGFDKGELTLGERDEALFTGRILHPDGSARGVVVRSLPVDAAVVL